jgi:predicted metal-binding membrane protein
VITPRELGSRPFLAVLVSLVALSWLALFVWGLSPYAQYLDHRILGQGGVTFGLQYAGLAALFVAGWTLMTVAMMLPTALPLLVLFRRVTRSRPDALRLAGCLIAGYLGVWVLVGTLAHAGDLGLHAVIERSHWLEERSWLIGVSTVMLAGAYQFAPLKSLCLDRCRSPYSFIVEHWRGGKAGLEALRLGVSHGWFCVGCCWALMLLMFVVGVGNLGWMLALGAVMAIEKNLPWGRRLSAPLGALLLAVGVCLFVAQVSAGVACAHDGGGCY